MQVVDASGRTVAVSGPGRQAGRTLGGGDWLPSRGESVKLTSGPAGAAKSVRYAEIARAHPAVRSAVGARAGVASRIPLHVYRPDPDSDRDGARIRVRPEDGGDGAELARLINRPEPGLSERKFKRRLLGDLLTQGNAIAEMRTRGALIVGLRWHPWVNTDVNLSDDGLRIDSFVVPVDHSSGLLGVRSGDTRTLDGDEVLHLTLDDDTEDPVGVSPIRALHATQRLYDAAMRFAAAYMDNGTFPTGVVEAPKEASAAQLTATRQLLEQLYAGVDLAGAPTVVPGKWKQISATPEGAKLVELARYSREEVAGTYHVPLSFLGSTGESNKATEEAERKRFVRDVVGGDVAVIESEFAAQVVTRSRRWQAAGLAVEGQMAEMLRPDMVELSQVIEREVGGPVATPNEARRWIGLNPSADPNADKLLLNPGTPGAGGAGGATQPLIRGLPAAAALNRLKAGRVLADGDDGLR